MKINTFIFYIFLLSVCILGNAAPPSTGGGIITTSSTGLLDAIFNRLFDISSASSPSFDFWKEAQRLGSNARNYVNDQLNLEVLKNASIATQIDDFKTAAQCVVDAAHELRPTMDTDYLERIEILETRQTLDEFIRILSAGIDTVIKHMQVEFSEPLPENRTERYKSREVAVDYALNLIEDEYVNAYELYDKSEDKAREKFGCVRPHIRSVVLIMGKITDDHPYLVDLIIFSLATLILPEFFILRPIARVFGISPAGAVKGSAAAWCQRFFFRGAVSKGSWFARLTQAGMKPAGGWFSRLMHFLFG